MMTFRFFKQQQILKQSAMDDLILRDYLALERTYLANERTFLTYSRTALTCLIAGVSLQKLFPQDVTMHLLSWFLLALVPIVGLSGLFLTWRMHRKIKSYYHNFSAPPSD